MFVPIIKEEVKQSYCYNRTVIFRIRDATNVHLYNQKKMLNSYLVNNIDGNITQELSMEKYVASQSGYLQNM